ncbi:MAG TPA: VOC family protein [Microlunatus sp.]|nr:VOC family protein [Microlunatus sp.]
MDGIDDVLAGAELIPLLPCGDIEDLAAFWVDLGLAVTYRQQRPNPYLALSRGGLVLHYYGMPDWDPESSHSTCVVRVTDTGPVFELFAAGLRKRFGRLPMSGLPRITRPRKRVNNQGLAGFSLVDPAGNWVRVSRSAGPAADTADAPSRLSRAVDNAIVLADSHGDAAQAYKILAGAVGRAHASPVREVAPALGYLAELALRLGDLPQAGSWRARLAALPAAAPSDIAAVTTALAEIDAVLPERVSEK